MLQLVGCWARAEQHGTQHIHMQKGGGGTKLGFAKLRRGEEVARRVWVCGAPNYDGQSNVCLEQSLGGIKNS